MDAISSLLCVLSWGVESPTPRSCLSRRDPGAGGWGEEGGRDTGPSQPLESGTGESDHEIACWTMTDWGTGGGGGGAVECIRMVRKMGF